MRNLTKVLSENLPDLTTADIEAVLGRCGYERPRFYDDEVERNGCPPFVNPFYIWLLEHGRIPTPLEHINLYFALYPWTDNGRRAGLEARILRAWPSLVRDLHLTALLREAGMRVTYSVDFDRAGIDVAVWPPLDGRPPLYVHAYVWSPRSEQFRRRKVRGPRHFDLPLHRREARVVGNVWLYQAPLHTERVRAAL
jgi:hypothetical protein